MDYCRLLLSPYLLQPAGDTGEENWPVTTGSHLLDWPLIATLRNQRTPEIKGLGDHLAYPSLTDGECLGGERTFPKPLPHSTSAHRTASGNKAAELGTQWRTRQALPPATPSLLGRRTGKQDCSHTCFNRLHAHGTLGSSACGEGVEGMSSARGR